MDGYTFQAPMSHKGNRWDNAVMERFFGSLKSEWMGASGMRAKNQRGAT
ncbi:hypothetical protein KUW00_01595 [Halomonas sp. DP5N14-9]|nr:hypothetical protein [Halomonas sp. DP5N14-9]